MWRRWRRAWNRRYVTRVLRQTREQYEEAQRELAQLSHLDDPTRRTLSGLLRTFMWQFAAFNHWPGWRGYVALRALTAFAAIVIPAFGVAVWTGGWSLAWIVSYLVFGGLLAVGYGVQQQVTRVWHVVAAACVVLVALGVAAAFVTPATWRGIAAGVLATGVLLVLTAARLALLLWVRATWVRPAARRRAGWLMPPQHAAVRLHWVLVAFGEARASSRHSRFRQYFLRWLAQTAGFLQWEVRMAVVDLRLGPAAKRDAIDKASRLAAYLRRMQVRLLHDRDLSEYDAAHAEIALLVQQLANGDWSTILAQEPELDAAPLRVRLLKRLLPGALLIGAAVALPFVPGISPVGGALTGIQLGLVAAAALSLLPVDQPHRDQIAGALSSATKP